MTEKKKRLIIDRQFAFKFKNLRQKRNKFHKRRITEKWSQKTLPILSLLAHYSSPWATRTLIPSWHHNPLLCFHCRSIIRLWDQRRNQPLKAKWIMVKTTCKIKSTFSASRIWNPLTRVNGKTFTGEVKRVWKLIYIVLYKGGSDRMTSKFPFP